MSPITSCPCGVLSRVRLFVTLWTVARQASLSMGFSWQEYWSGLPCPPPRDRTRVSYVFCTRRRALYRWCHLGSPISCPGYCNCLLSRIPASNPNPQVCSPRGRQRAPVNTYVSSRRFSAQCPEESSPRPRRPCTTRLRSPFDLISPVSPRPTRLWPHPKPPQGSWCLGPFSPPSP